MCCSSESVSWVLALAATITGLVMCSRGGEEEDGGSRGAASSPCSSGNSTFDMKRYCSATSRRYAMMVFGLNSGPRWRRARTGVALRATGVTRRFRFSSMATRRNKARKCSRSRSMAASMASGVVGVDDAWLTASDPVEGGGLAKVILSFVQSCAVKGSFRGSARYTIAVAIASRVVPEGGLHSLPWPHAETAA